MTVKKTLVNRIRGWFPQESNISKVPARIDFQPMSKKSLIALVGVVVSLIFAVLFIISVGLIVGIYFFVPNVHTFVENGVLSLNWRFGGLGTSLISLAIDGLSIPVFCYSFVYYRRERKTKK